MAYITCENLALGYEGHTIVENLYFSLKAGDYLCIVGENGTGKSTLIKTLLHLQEPLGGKISMGDGLKPYDIGYLPQQTMVQRDFPATAWEIVLSGTLSHMGFRPFYGKKEKKLAEETMKKLHIWELRYRCYRTLSGGQQQRILLARALCATEKVLLLDEPMTGLDPMVTAEFYQILQKLNQEGIAILMVSHDIQAIPFASHILHLKHKDSFYGTCEEYQNSPNWELFCNYAAQDLSC